MDLLNSELFALILLPALIFLARIADVSIGTLRIMFISKGLRHIAPIMAFFEITIWLLAIGQIFQNLTNPIYYLAYAGGFASGTFVGMAIEEKMSIGSVIVRAITRKEASKLFRILKADGCIVTISHADSDEGPVDVIYIVVDRHDLRRVIHIIREHNPKAFYSVEDLKQVSDKVHHHGNRRRANRKGK